jgi:DNA-binding response OmpR family regulator
MRLLLVEDEEVLGRFTTQALNRAHFAVDWVKSCTDAQAAIRDHDYDVIVLDLGLPDMPGATLLKPVRAKQASTAVIVLTARGQIEDRVAMLDMGADDYMVKPFDVNELQARIRAVKRRSTAFANGSDRYAVGPLELFPASRTVRWHGKNVLLTTKEYDVLEALVVRRPGIVSRAQLEEAIYGWGDEVESNSIEVYIHFLRRKLTGKLIVNVRGKGYQIGSEELLYAATPGKPA